MTRRVAGDRESRPRTVRWGHDPSALIVAAPQRRSSSPCASLRLFRGALGLGCATAAATAPGDAAERRDHRRRRHGVRRRRVQRLHRDQDAEPRSARGAGAKLDQFYVQPVCSPTRAALMTGRYPMRHGLQVGVVRPWAQYGLPLEERTLAAGAARTRATRRPSRASGTSATSSPSTCRPAAGSTTSTATTTARSITSPTTATAGSTGTATTRSAATRATRRTSSPPRR